MTKTYQIAVLGGGSWGTALASTLASKHLTNIYLRQQTIVDEINQEHTNNQYLRNTKLPANLQAFNLNDFTCTEDILIMALPSVNLVEYIHFIKDKLQPETFLVLASKGLDYANKTLFTKTISNTIPNKVGILAGPNFAQEVALGYRTSTSLALADIEDAKFLSKIMSTNNFIVYPSDDVVTLQVAGCVKNVVAIACGIIEGLRYGENTKAWLLSKGLQEIVTLAKFFDKNVKPDCTSVGISGDMVLTCYSLASRNTKFGFGLAAAKNAQKYLDSIYYLAEGSKGAKHLAEIALEHNLALPIITSIAKILQNPAKLRLFIEELFCN
jgi:glycerol-3-phosphate dehydrogenase (NAD(P)+)